ncbi:hypothetical protein Tco_1202507 [Tanacetum coccineum]
MLPSCSNECKESYANLKRLYDAQREQLSDASVEIKAYTQGLKKVEAQLVAHQQGQLWYEQKIKFMKIDLDDKTDVLTYHKKLLAKAQKEKDDLEVIVDKWNHSSKNLGKIINYHMSASDKFGLGYGDYRYSGILSYENEVSQSVFKCNKSDFENLPLHKRLGKTCEMQAVPPPMTGNYLPSGPDIEIDDSQYTYGPEKTQPSESVVSEFETQTTELDTCNSNISTEPSELVSEPVVNESNVEVQPKVWSDAPIIEEYESDSDDEYVSVQTKGLDTPSFANKQVKTPRENVKNQSTHSQKPKVNNKELGNGFTERACFVCGSFSHLIRDCDYHVKLAKQVELNKQNMSKGNGTRERKPTWNNVQRVNKQNQFVPLAVQTRTGNIPVNTAKASGTNNFSTARQNVNRKAVLTSTVLKVNAVKPIVNGVRPANVFHKTHSPSSRPLKRTTVLKTNFSNQKVYTVKVKQVSTVGEKWVTAVKSSAGCKWRTPGYNNNILSKYNGGSSLRNYSTFKDPLGRLKPQQAYGPLRESHEGNKATLLTFKTLMVAHCFGVVKAIILAGAAKSTVLTFLETISTTAKASDTNLLIQLAYQLELPILMRDYLFSDTSNSQEDDSEIPPQEDIHQDTTDGRFQKHLKNESWDLEAMPEELHEAIRIFLHLPRIWLYSLNRWTKVPFSIARLDEEDKNDCRNPEEGLTLQVSNDCSLMYVTASRPDTDVSSGCFQMGDKILNTLLKGGQYEGMLNNGAMICQPTPLTVTELSLLSNMAALESCPKHNMIAYLEKTEGNVEFHEVIDFLRRSYIFHALTVPFEQQPDPSPRPSPRPSPKPSPTPIVPDSIPEPTGENLGDHSSNDTSLSGKDGYMTLQNATINKPRKQAKPVIKHHKAYLKSVSLAAKDAQEELPKNIGRTREMVDEDKEFDEVRLSTEDVVSTDKEGVSTDFEKVYWKKQRKVPEEQKEASQHPLHTPTTYVYMEMMKTIATLLLNMSQAKAASKEKEKGVELKDVEEIDRPRPTSQRSLLTLKPLPKIDPKDKGKKKIVEDGCNQKVTMMIYLNCEKIKQLESVMKKWLGKIQEEKREAERSRQILVEKLQEQEKSRAQKKKEQIMKSKKFEDIQAMYEKIKRSDEDFIAIGSVEDDRLIKRMNKKDSSKGEEIKQESKEEVKEEDKGEEQLQERRKQRTKLDDALLKVLERHTADLIEKYSVLPGLEPSAGSNQGKSTKRRRHDSGASGSAQPPTKDDEQSSKKPRESDASASKQHPALTSTGWQITDTRDVVDEGHVSDLEDTDNAHIPKVSTTTWFKPIPEGERPATPEPEWTIPPNDFPEPENNWANTYATTYQVPTENKLQRKTYDIGSFIKWFCRRTGKKKLCKADLEGPAFNLVKAFHKNSVFLQYQMDECHKLLTNKVDLGNPEGHQILRNIYEPLPLGGPPGDKERKIALSSPSINAAPLPRLWLERISFPSMWCESEPDYDDQCGLWHHSLVVLEERNIHHKPVSPLIVKHQSQMRILSVISVKKSQPYCPRQTDSSHTAVNKWIQNQVNSETVGDLQLRIESYQTKINLERPNWDAADYYFKEDYTIVPKPRAVVYRDRNDQRKLDEWGFS